ncbi:STAS domain-containing protein [Nocardioides pantholopis]|uniref:STAS domain-containing protein n=1 Tax=Nocardioides pantholopis TaxID=2483798 RepID=UPI000F07EB91|nr:STAS domain-containing protein [Nocardioides pantholopis]
MDERPFAVTASPGVLKVSGSVDEYAVIALRNALREQTQDYTRSLAVELSDADYLPSVAVSVLVTAIRSAGQNGVTVSLVARTGTIAQRVLLVCALPYSTELPDIAESSETPPGPSVVA